MSSFWSNLLRPSGTKRFESLIRPLTIEPISAHLATNRDVPKVLAFLEQHFGSPPKTPVLRPVLDPSNSIILMVQDQSELVATIRYKYAGQFEGQPVHIIDCFCIHPSKRGSGLGTKLLATLHHYTMEQGLRYSLFLKEGRPLPFHTPLYSSTYVYRQLKGVFKSPGAISLSPHRASALVAAYRQFHPDVPWLNDSKNENQLWLFWKEGLEWILICVQDAFQTMQGGRIGWMTACFASEPLRSGAFEALVESAPYSWIWMDRVWLPENAEGWTSDGPFHWYAYQWSTNCRFERFYGLVV
jgi:Acetyltransferase (GNAT) family